MKDQYACDVGDYVKLGLLRALFHDRKLAVNWFRTANDPASNDGKFIGYLSPEQEQKWRQFDPELYDYFRSVVASGNRSIDALTRFLVSPGREFYSSLIERPSARAVWFASFSRWLSVSDALFLDPDNGISLSHRAPSPKSVTIDEIQYLLSSVDTLLIYHHQTRAKGGHTAEIMRIGAELAPTYSYRSACAIRAPSGSARAFFLVGADKEIWSRAEDFCKHWAPVVTFIPITTPPDELGLIEGASAYHRVDAQERRGWI